MTILSGNAGEAAAAILDEHRRADRTHDHTWRCTCGWTSPQQTHAQHVVHRMQMAGLDVVWR